MQSPDVNILVHAFRADTEEHALCHAWMERLINGPAAFSLVPNCLSGFLRIVTHPRVFRNPSPVSEALAFCERLWECDLARVVGPGPRHWDLFARLCIEADARGNLIPDAWFASVAIENGCEWITLDRDYARFPGLRWRVPSL